jgi:hypothetical protein
VPSLAAVTDFLFRLVLFRLVRFELAFAWSLTIRAREARRHDSDRAAVPPR